MSRWHCIVAETGYDLDEAIAEYGLAPFEAESAIVAAELTAEEWFSDDGCEDGETVDVWVRELGSHDVQTIRVAVEFSWRCWGKVLPQGAKRIQEIPNV